MNRIFLLALLLFSFVSAAHAAVHWSYDGNEGPENWGRLSREFSRCATGKNQSPIDIRDVVRTKLKPLVFTYTSHAQEIENTGLGILLNFAEGSSMTVDKQQFELKQALFHMPGEHLVNGKSFPMEIQLLHADKDGNQAIVSVMVSPGKANPVLEKILDKLPSKAGKRNELGDNVTGLNLLPKSRSYYRYNGSLTTPPCTEGVRWLVMKSAIQASSEQLRLLNNVMKGSNNRPLQEINARQVIE